MEQYNKIGIGARIGCMLIGWNSHILKECGESSRRALRKYVSAIIILSIIWGTIGYCFGERYIGMESVLGRCAVSLTFITIIICVERYIILTGKLSKWTFAFRILIAVLMALLGSSIFDQIIFKNDVEYKMISIKNKMIQEEVAIRNSQIEKEVIVLTHDIDSLNRINSDLRAEISKKPIIQTNTYENVKKYVGENEDGTPKFVNEIKSTSHIIPNSLNGQVNANDSTISRYENRKTFLQNKKLETEPIVRKEIEEKGTGFLQELNVLWDIITEDFISLAFYFALLLFLLLLEMLVVTTKSGDEDCDYDLIIRHQQTLKKFTLEKMERELKNIQ